MLHSPTEATQPDFDASCYDGPIPPIPDDLVFPENCKARDRIRWAFANGCPAIIFNWNDGQWNDGQSSNLDIVELWAQQRRSTSATNGDMPDSLKRRYAQNTLRGRRDDLSALKPDCHTRDTDTSDAIWYLAGLHNDGYLTEAEIIDAIVDSSRANGHAWDNKSIVQIEDDVRRGLAKATHGFDWDRIDWYTTDYTDTPAGTETDQQASDFEDNEPTTWEPVDLEPYLRGEITQPKPALGMPRTDGLHLIYPGREHVVLGDTESGKTWYADGCAAAELARGETVVYIHYEEPDATSTIERLRLLGIDDDTIRERFKFVGPTKPAALKAWLDALIALHPSLVVHDGVNEAMSLHGYKIQEADGAAKFRRHLVVPFTSRGIATLACDHLPKAADTSRIDAYGSVHKGNALDGARILLENVKPFGRNKRGVSYVFITKDRPGYLRSHGKPASDDTPGKTFVGVLVVDDTHTFKPFEMRFFAPRIESDDTATETKPTRTLADDVWEVVFASKDHTVESTRALKAELRGANVKARAARIDDAVDDLLRDGRLVAVYGKRGAKGYEAQAIASDSESIEEEQGESD